MKSFILSKVAQLLFPVTVVFAIYLLVRGHNHPGGGFSAGLVTSLAVVMQVFAFGFQWTRKRLFRVLRPALWIGLVIALLAGVFPMFIGEPFLTHYHLKVPLTSEAEVSLSTTLLFDLGVYATVVGTTTTVLASIAEEVRA
jgi:multisubunit Na+/H+ antiporter MnhB subunit